MSHDVCVFANRTFATAMSKSAKQQRASPTSVLYVLPKGLADGWDGNVFWTLKMFIALRRC